MELHSDSIGLGGPKARFITNFLVLLVVLSVDHGWDSNDRVGIGGRSS